MEEHNQFISQERQFVNHQRFLANSADDGFYMEIDGMDQSKTNLPHWPNMPKNINKDLLMQIHVTGVRYSDGRQNDIYLYPSTFAHDSACTCTIIYLSVTKVNYFIPYKYLFFIFNFKTLISSLFFRRLREEKCFSEMFISNLIIHAVRIRISMSLDSVLGLYPLGYAGA